MEPTLPDDLDTSRRSAGRTALTTATLCLLWALWPAIAFMGGLGFVALAGVAALVLAPSAVRAMRPKLYIGALLAFFVFVGISAMWSPRDVPLVEFDFGKMKFAVRSEMIRVGLLVVAVGALMAAASRMGEEGRRRVAQVASFALIVQLVVLVLLALFEEQALQLFSAFMPDSGEGVQNISRNSLIMAVAAPSLVLMLAEGRSRLTAIVIGLVVLGATVAILQIRGVQAGLLALAAAIGAIVVVRILPRHGFKVLAVGIALIIMTAPWLFGFLSQGGDFATANDSPSYRAAIWQRVIEVINQHPVLGNGVGVLRTIRETIETGVFAGQLTVPNHSHNMTLQLWAETGAIGAGLLSLAILLLGWRLPSGEKLGSAGLRAAGLAGGMMVVACVSFDLWNEWWWAVGGLLGVLAIAAPRDVAPAERKAKTVTTITFDGGAGSARVIADDEPPATARGNAAAVDVQEPEASRAVTGNNFNLLRLLFALMVVVYHVVFLPGVPGWERYESWTSVGAEIGVQGFFVLSGYLVWESLQRSRWIALYAEKRARRLLPAYFTVVIACAVVALVVSPEARADLAAVGRYLGWNLAFLNFMEPSLPGLFEANRFTEINGALWTLKIEVMFYLVLPVLALMLRLSGKLRWLLFLLIYVAAEIWRFGFEQTGISQGRSLFVELSRQLPGQMSFFIVGVALAAWRDHINWRSPLPLVGLGLMALSLVFPAAEPARALGLGLTVVWLAVGVPRLFDPARFGDLSYGLYIVHFPIVQAVIAAGLFAGSVATGIGVSFAIAIVAALLLWWLVERPALRRDSTYRSAH